jgi:hypothetical protein
MPSCTCCWSTGGRGQPGTCRRLPRPRRSSARRSCSASASCSSGGRSWRRGGGGARGPRRSRRRWLRGRGGRRRSRRYWKAPCQPAQRASRLAASQWAATSRERRPSTMQRRQLAGRASLAAPALEGRGQLAASCRRRRRRPPAMAGSSLKCSAGSSSGWRTFAAGVLPLPPAQRSSPAGRPQLLGCCCPLACLACCLAVADISVPVGSQPACASLLACLVLFAQASGLAAARRAAAPAGPSCQRGGDGASIGSCRGGRGAFRYARAAGYA